MNSLITALCSAWPTDSATTKSEPEMQGAHISRHMGCTPPPHSEDPYTVDRRYLYGESNMGAYDPLGTTTDFYPEDPGTSSEGSYIHAVGGSLPTTQIMHQVDRFDNVFLITT